MRSKHIVIAIAIVAVATGLGGDKNAALAADQNDLCGGTNGNGQIVSVEGNSFTVRLNEGGEKGGGNLIVTLTDRATIETSTGHASVSDLKIGDRVTLVGDNHRDGTFTADAVMVCSATQEAGAQSSGTDRAMPITVRNKNSEAYEKVSSVVNTATILLVGLIWLSIATFLRVKKRKGLVYLLFFTVFYIYLYKVLDYTLIQFQSLLLLRHFVPDLILNGFKDGTNVNLIPLITLTPQDIKTSLLNVVMMLPFGFGSPFISSFRFKKVVIAGLLFSIVIELLQLITGFVANTTFRVADINDLIFNTIGVAIGYILFAQFVLAFRSISRNWKISTDPILRHIAERPQIDNQEN